MQAVRAIVKPRGGRISLAVPSAFSDMDIEVLAFPAQEAKARLYDFSDLAGKLAWRGDAVREQRALRDEW